MHGGTTIKKKLVKSFWMLQVPVFCLTGNKIIAAAPCGVQGSWVRRGMAPLILTLRTR
jgi:hypothetical protein